MPSLIDKQRFFGLQDVTHLAAGGEGPVLQSHSAAMARFFTDKSGGMEGRSRVTDTERRTRQAVAEFWGARAEEIAFVANSSDGLTIVAHGVDWREGDNVVLEAVEFPSVLHVWRRLPAAGVEIRAVGESETPSLDAIRQAVTGRTRVIAVSQVSYLTGLRHNLAALRDIADSVGARLIVDATHAAGVVPVPVDLCDATISSCYKFLLGVQGVALLRVHPRRWPDLQPPSVGWHSIQYEDDWRRRGAFRFKETAERFEMGSCAFGSIYCLEDAVRILSGIGAERIEDHVLDLGGRLRQGIADLGWRVLTPAPRDQRAANVAFATDDSDRVEREFFKRSVLVWSGDGRIRLSLHAYSDEEDVDRALHALAAIGR